MYTIAIIVASTAIAVSLLVVSTAFAYSKAADAYIKILTYRSSQKLIAERLNAFKDAPGDGTLDAAGLDPHYADNIKSRIVENHKKAKRIREGRENGER